MNWSDVLVLAAYATLVIELTCFPIPSEASTWQLLAAGPDAAHGGGELARARRRSLLPKLLFYVLPTVIGVLLFLIPLLCIASPTVRAAVHAEEHAALVVAGAIAVVVGRLITFGSVLQLRAARTSHDGVPGGWYRWSRNPGLVGMFVFYLGLCAIFAVPVMAIGIPIYFANMHHRVRMEETHLAQRLGDAWRDYAGRVPRYMPLPGLR